MVGLCTYGLVCTGVQAGAGTGRSGGSGDTERIDVAEVPQVYRFLVGWRCDNGVFSGVGLTRDEAIDAWVQNVKDIGHPGGFNERHAKIAARKLKSE